jgi:hypothetical protein
MKSIINCRVLDRECGVFCRYLIGENPNEYIKKKYRDAHLGHPFTASNASHPFDEFLLGMASVNTWTTRLIDVYSVVFQPSSLVRKKLILLLAILESSAPTHRFLDSVDSNFLLFFLMKCVFRLLTFFGVLVVVIVLIFPLQLFVRGSVNFLRLCLARHG